MIRAVGQIRDQHVAAVNAGDADAASALFAADGIFLPPGQPALEGITAIRAWFTHVFANFRLAGFALHPGAVDERGDIAIEHGTWNATFTSEGWLTGPARRRHLSHRVCDGSRTAACGSLRDTFNGLPA